MSPAANAFHRYLAYANYLDTLADLINQLYPTDEALVQEIASLRGFQIFKRDIPCSLDDIAQTMRHSWYTELLMQRTARDADMFPFVVPWSMVHAYYAINRGMEAYFMLSREQIPLSHTGALKTMGNELISKNNPFPQPWRTFFDGDPAKTTITLTHCTMNGPVTLTNPMARPDDPWQNYGLLLRTTRKRLAEEAVTNWKRRTKRRRISREQRDHLVGRMMPTTFFDAIYRMRVRSNYQDSDSFIFSRVPAEDTIGLHVDLCDIVYATLCVFESLLAKVTPPGWYGDIVEEFVEATGQAAEDTVQARWKVIQPIVT